jgi:glutathione S-transferase
MPATQLIQPAQPIRLYTTALSGHGHRVEAFLRMIEVPFEVIELDLPAGANRTPEYLAINRFGEVPAIVDGAVVLSDSNAILVYLARTYAEPGWLPDDALGAAALQRWLSIAAGKLAYGPCAARLVTVFGAPRDHESAKRIAVTLFDVIEPEFADQPFCVGARATIADIAAYAYIAHAPEGGISLQPYPNLRAWLRRVEALPRFVGMRASKAG